MVFRIRLDAIKHSEFLSEQRIDPVTHELLRSGDEIVICAAQTIAFSSANWNGRCPLCGESETLPEIPHNAISETISQARFTHRSPITQNHRRNAIRNTAVPSQVNIELSMFFLGFALAFVFSFFDFFDVMSIALFNILVLITPLVGFKLSKRFRSNWFWKWILYNIVYHGLAIASLVLGSEGLGNYILSANFLTGILLVVVNTLYKVLK